MRAFDPAFRILTILGFWKPPSWDCDWRGRVYDRVRVILIPLPYWLAYGQIAHILLETKNLDEMTETLFLMLETVNVCCKVTNILLERTRIAELMRMMKLDFALPHTDEETVIYEYYNNFIRLVYVVGGSMVQATLLTGLLVPYFKAKYSLPVEVWLPYDYTASTLLFCLTYAMNSVCALSMGNLSIGTDVTINGLMVATSAQCDLLAHRFSTLAERARLSEEPAGKLLGRCIRHHAYVYDFADKFRRAFGLSILAQFLVSSTAVSVSVYQFTSNTSAASLEFLMKLLYLLSVILQLFLFCWFGEQLAIKSQELGDTVLNCDWTSLDVKSVRSLLFVAQRTRKPIIISSGYFVTFSLDTFKKILKVSYSAFNVLRDSSDAD